MTWNLSWLVNIDINTPILTEEVVNDVFFADIIITFILVLFVFFDKIFPWLLSKIKIW